VIEALRIHELENAVEVSLHVLPRARCNEICGLHNGALKIKITAPPVDDAANQALIKYFGALLSIPRSRLKIVCGEKSRDKTLRIDGLSRHDLLRHLGNRLY
jgi:uncharacterized protein (TIGR00251 family)